SPPPSFTTLPRPPTSTLFPYTTLFRSILISPRRPDAVEERAHGLPRRIGTDGQCLGERERHVRRKGHRARRRRVELIDVLRGGEDRKSTRLNSSHVAISYAVFCLKKKN